MNLDTKISEIDNRIAKIAAKKLANLGVSTIRDLLLYFPFRYDDLSKIILISELTPDTVATVKVKISLLNSRRSRAKRKMLTEAIVEDKSGSMKVIWFNQGFIAKILKIGDEVYLSGKVSHDEFGLQMISPVYEKLFKKETTSTARIVPVYSTTARLTQKQIRFIIQLILKLTEELNDIIPEAIRRKESLMGITEAVKEAHFPSSFANLDKAVKRLKFEELFLLQLLAQKLRLDLKNNNAPKIVFEEEKTKDFVARLPFALTNAQRKSAWEILKDLEQTAPMNRLLEGDVGSGKTVVAGIAMLNVFLSGYKTILLAPTEILARQHFQTLAGLFADSKIKIGLLTRSEKRTNFEISHIASSCHPELAKDLSDYSRHPAPLHSAQNDKTKKESIIQNSDIIIGTHALLQDKIKIDNAGLVIVDEQHRFGVKQRAKLLERGKTQNKTRNDADNSRESAYNMPHLLSMTATPIPRTLALALYGDLDISIINELPKERKKIITYYVSPEKRQGAYDFICKQINEGRQIFVICPLIDESDKLGVKSVKQEYEKLDKKVFPDIPVGILHGKLKPKEKEEAMNKFLNNEIKILLSTSAVEVGIDVPNATVVMIEGADRFGLAQLHQFRGRVGRSCFPSYCFLFSENDNKKVRARMSALIKSKNGFELAEYDLKFRGAGEIYGARQSGFIDLRVAKLTDVDLIKIAQKEAGEIISKIEQYPLLRQQLEGMEKEIHLE